MAAVTRFEDLTAWQKARELTSAIYAITQSGPFSRDFGLKDQIRRASISIMANIAEGFERGRRQEFHQFLSIAKASCGEVRSHLYVALDTGHITKNEFEKIIRVVHETGRIVNGLRMSVAKKITSEKVVR